LANFEHLGLAAGALWLVACTELAPGTDRLDQRIGTNFPDSGLSSDERWTCLGQPGPSEADRLVPTVDLALAVADGVTNTVPEGLTARACPRLDVLCDTPVGAAVAATVDGMVHLPVPQSFDGYEEITSPTGVPTMYFLNRDLLRDTVEVLPLVSRLALGGLAQQASIVLDPMLGHLLIRVFDCAGAPASDVELSTNGGGTPFVFVDGLPNVGVEVTADDGLGGFVNVPMGYAVLQGRLVPRDVVIGTASVVVRPGWFTYGDVEPLPQ
jgi:hypothetical protein